MAIPRYTSFLGCHFSGIRSRFSTQAVLLLKVILRFLEAVSAGKAEAHGQVGGKTGTFCGGRKSPGL